MLVDLMGFNGLEVIDLRTNGTGSSAISNVPQKAREARASFKLSSCLLFPFFPLL